MRETIGAFEIGVMPVLEAKGSSIEMAVDQQDVWQMLATLLVQVFACFGQAH